MVPCHALRVAASCSLEASMFQTMYVEILPPLVSCTSPRPFRPNNVRKTRAKHDCFDDNRSFSVRFMSHQDIFPYSFGTERSTLFEHDNLNAIMADLPLTKFLDSQRTLRAFAKVLHIGYVLTHQSLDSAAKQQEEGP